MRISDWSSEVCSSDLCEHAGKSVSADPRREQGKATAIELAEQGDAERVPGKAREDPGTHPFRHDPGSGESEYDDKKAPRGQRTGAFALTKPQCRPGGQCRKGRIQGQVERKQEDGDAA